MLRHYSKVWFRRAFQWEPCVRDSGNIFDDLQSQLWCLWVCLSTTVFALVSCQRHSTPFSCPSNDLSSSHWVSTWKSTRTSINCLQAAPHDPVLNEQERQMLQIFHFKSWRIYKNVKVCKTRTIPWHFLLTCLQEVSCFSCCDEAYFLLSFICQHGSVSFFLFVIKEKKLWKAGFCLNNESTDCSLSSEVLLLSNMENHRYGWKVNSCLHSVLTLPARYCKTCIFRRDTASAH